MRIAEDMADLSHSPAFSPAQQSFMRMSAAATEVLVAGEPLTPEEWGALLSAQMGASHERMVLDNISDMVKMTDDMTRQCLRLIS